jgi:hypothetical protein
MIVQFISRYSFYWKYCHKKRDIALSQTPGPGTVSRPPTMRVGG